MERRGESVVGRLAHVDVVVGMAKLFARDLIGAVGDDLVGVHVALRAASGLPYDQGEVLVELSFDDFVASLGDGLELFGGHLLRLKSVVGHGGGLFEVAESLCDFARHSLDANANLKVFVAALCLGAPVFVGGNFHLAH